MTVPAHSALTPREAQIVQRLVEGNTIREVAAGYGIAPQTVKNYVTVIYEKLGVCGRTELQRVASVRLAADS